VQAGLCDSKSDARRQIEQGGVKVDDQVVDDVKAVVKAGAVIQKYLNHGNDLIWMAQNLLKKKFLI
jgi:tyrosyl-tRNA synthetase